MDQNQEPLGRGADGTVGRRSDAVAAELVRMIQSGTFQEGQRLPAERDLMQRYGVSRSAVREAIVSLANRGLIETRRGHRPIVRKADYEIAVDRVGNIVGHLVVDRKGVWNLFETRIFIEAALARWAANHARRVDIDDLRAALDENREAIGDSHWRSMRRGAGIDQMNHAGHQAIFEAIAARDPDSAEEAMRRHLVAAWEFVRSTFPVAGEAAQPGEDVL